MQNSGRFVTAYNRIDKILRSLYNYKDNMTFSDIVRRCVVKNYIVRMYEDDLIAYARLRNAIVHKSIESEVIAEPHDDVTENIEKIAKLLTTPPRVIESLSLSKVVTFKSDDKLKYAIEKIAQSGFSNIPIYENTNLVGVINNKDIVEILGAKILQGVDIDEFVSQVSLKDIAIKNSFSIYYSIIDKDATLDEILNCFQENRRLRAVLITPQGSNIEQPLGIVTPADILEITNILDNY